VNVVIFEHLLGNILRGHEVWLQVLASGLTNTFGDHVTIVGEKSLSSDVKSVIGEEFDYAAEFELPITHGMHSHSTKDLSEERKKVATDISRVIEKYADADLHIFPTAFPVTALGLVSARNRAKNTTLLFHHSHDDRVDAPLLEATNMLSAFSNLSRSSLACFAQSPSLAAEFLELGISCKVAPYPFFGALPKTPRQGPLRRLGIFGHQRKDKNNGLLLPLMNKLLAAGLEVVYHNSKGTPCVLAHERLTKIERHLPPNEFATQIAGCDAVIITNEPALHAKRISGVCLDALSAGVPVIVPDKTHMSRLANSGRAGVCYKDRSVDGICAAIELAGRNYANLGSNAFHLAKWLHNTGGYERLTATLRG